MPIDADLAGTAGTAEWWLLQLGKRLDDQMPALEMLNNYDRGEHTLPTGHQRARATYQQFTKQSRTNYVGLVTDAVMDRLKVGGFRMGGQGDQSADETAQLIWQANQMDAESRLVMRDALVMRRSYVCVGPDPDGDLSNSSGVLLTGEDPRQNIHAVEPTNRRRVRAHLKCWHDEIDNRDHAVVYLPEGVHYFVAAHAEGSIGRFTPSRWSVDADEGADGVIANPTAPFVPIVPFVNRPEKDPMGFGEAEDVLPIQDRINQQILDRLVISFMQAFRQRWGKGIEFKDEKGNPVDPFEPGVDLLWHVTNDKAEFGDFAQTDLSPIIKAAQADVEMLASISRTPPYYLLGEMINISGDALTAADTGATSKAESRQECFGESWEHVQALSFRILGREVAPDAETIWADAERRNEAKSADAAVKKQAVGVPWRQIMEDLGYSPAQIERMKVDRASDMLQAQITAAAQASTVQASPPVATPETNQGQPVPEPIPASINGRG